MEPIRKPSWSTEPRELFEELASSPAGLPASEARRRKPGQTLPGAGHGTGKLNLFLVQFRSPIIFLLLAAAGLSAFLKDFTDSAIILAIVLASGYLQYREERKAGTVIAGLLEIIRTRSVVLREGEEAEVPSEEIVPGDVVILNAGDIIPGDSLILQSGNLFVDEATLTGETFPVEKKEGLLPAETPLAQRTNSLFMGTHVISGTATALVVETGQGTEFGKIAGNLRLRPPETEFERGVRRFGYMLMEWTLLLVIVIFAVNVYMKRPFLDAFLFALALAVGFTPQLLPAIISVTLAKGAKRLAEKKVIVRRLASIENFGSMDVLCSDKTGTLTEGIVTLKEAIGVDGGRSEKVLFYAYLNAFFESGFDNPLDQAIRAQPGIDVSGYRKTGEIPYDFIRKRLTVRTEFKGSSMVVTKGAVEKILAVCSWAEGPDGKAAPLPQVEESLRKRYRAMSRRGLRLLAVACLGTEPGQPIGPDLEKDMTFLGFLVFLDPPKQGAAQAVETLRDMGIALKMITGDNRFVAAAVSRRIGLSHPALLTGPEMREMSEEALVRKVGEVDVFAEVEPNQKERIVLALKKAGNVVGYLGDGINDATALHAADAGVSVDTAVPVVKEAADIVLLEKGLDVLAGGVREGRKIFANTLKYVMISTSANFGNMFSMAFVSPFLPFLPLLPKQILLNNLLTDIPAMAIADDRVDPEMVQRPRRWDLGQIRRFMVVFGLQSSVFDLITFAVLLLVLHAGAGEFRTGWFLESAVSEIFILLVIRTRRTFFRSPPGRYLAVAGGVMTAAAVVFVLPPLGNLMGFDAIPASYAGALMVILGLYVSTAEWTKGRFFRNETDGGGHLLQGRKDMPPDRKR